MAEARYSAAFIAKCKRVYPKWRDLHLALDAGREIVGRYLSDASNERISPDEVIDAISLDELKAHARQIKAQDDLCRQWYIEADRMTAEVI